MRVKAPTTAPIEGCNRFLPHQTAVHPWHQQVNKSSESNRDDRFLKVFRFRCTKECRDIRSPICKQVKAAPQFRLGTSHRTAEPTEFARFHEITRDFEHSQKDSIAPLFRSHDTEIRLLYHNSRKNGAIGGFPCDSGLSLSKEMRIMHK